MPLWRCPHCATPQAETARCWVCHRSTTACGACRHFRRAVAGQLGYCGLDRRRQPLTGDEIRACWEAADASGTVIPSLPGVGAAWPLAAEGDRTSVRPLQFIEVQLMPRKPAAEAAERSGDVSEWHLTDSPMPDPPPVGGRRGDPPWSLWGEPEG